MNNKNLLIGAGVVVVGYLLYKKSQNKVNQTQYSKECLDKLKRRLEQEDVKPANFEKIFLENCEKSKNKIQRGDLGMPIATLGSNEQWKDIELSLKVGKLPDEFVVKSNGYATRYYQVRGNWGSTVYGQGFRTDGSIGGSPPIKISNDEFLKAYDIFLKQPK
jgi:hypothetical protein